MSVTAAIAAVGTAAGTAKKVYDIAIKIQNAELNNTIGDLMNELADAKVKLAELKEEILRLEAENKSLKAPKEREKPEKTVYNCYRFAGDPNLYCPACYDTEGTRHLTARVNSQHRVCTVCNRKIPSS